MVNESGKPLTTRGAAGITRRGMLRRGAAAAAAACLMRDDWLHRVQAATARAGDRSAVELASDESFWVEIQQAFAIDRSVINLNNGGVSPCPRSVQDALRRHLEFANQNPAHNQESVLKPQIERVRSGLASAFGCDPEEMAIVRNASEALETCLFGMDLKFGDEVLTTTLDYPRMIHTIRQRETREGVRIRQIDLPLPLEHPAQAVAAFAEAITPATKLILCSHVIFVTGQILPVRDLCRLGRERGIPVIVDGAHAFAHLPFSRDELECDYYGTSLHKWLTACLGSGFLYVRRNRIASLWPLMAASEPLSGDIRKFEEIGTHPYANKLAIAEALALHLAIGGVRRSERLRALRERWTARLGADRRVSFYTRFEPEHACGIATMRIEGVEPTALHTHLWSRHRIGVTHIDYHGVRGVRVTPNIYTTPEEVDAFCAAVEDVLAHGIPS